MDYLRNSIVTLINQFDLPCVVTNTDGKLIGSNPSYKEWISFFRGDFEAMHHVNDLPYPTLLRNKEASNKSVVNVGERSYTISTVNLQSSKECFGIEIIKELFHENPISSEVETILNSIQDGLYITDGEGNTLWINENYTKKTGIGKNSVIGINVRELVEDGFFDQSITLQVLEKGESVVILQRIKNSGEEMLVQGNPIFNEKGEITKVINILHDVTELSKLKAELKEKECYVQKIEKELRHLRSQLVEIDGLVASSYEMKKVLSVIKRLAEVDTTVLLLGESGTGKSALSKLIHNLSSRKSGPFVQINCGAVPEHLLEAELFGYVKGSFTGANKEGKIGLIELADEGTLFLDEIGEMPLALQVKLLHFLQEKMIRRLGDTKDRTVNVRIVAATNRDLEELISEKKFREDLYYRLAVVPVQVPPLRERLDDISPLINYFIEKFSKKYNLKRILSNKVEKLLEAHSWPGNVRELENLIEQLVIMSKSEIITVDDLPPKIIKNQDSKEKESIENIKIYVDSMERDLIMKVWESTKNTREAADILGVHRTTLTRKAKRLGLRLI